jgi:uncharacterized protein (DUF885 family)
VCIRRVEGIEEVGKDNVTYSQESSHDGKREGTFLWNWQIEERLVLLH